LINHVGKSLAKIYKGQKLNHANKFENFRRIIKNNSGPIINNNNNNNNNNNTVTCVLKIRVVKSAESAVARERLCKHARCLAMAQYPSCEGYKRQARNKRRAVGRSVFSAIRVEAT
jgi:hypothetical protein